MFSQVRSLNWRRIEWVHQSANDKTTTWPPAAGSAWKSCFDQLGHDRSAVIIQRCAACPRIDHFTYYCLGSQGGKLWVVMRLLGPIACRKVCRNTAEICKTTGLSFWIVGFQFQLFLQTIGLDAATSSPLTGLRLIVSPLELNVRVRSRRRSSLPSQALLQLPSRKARQVREELAETGKQIEEHKKRAWGRNGAFTCLLECENASSKVALSHTLFWERERKRRLAEAFISGLSVVQWEALWKALGIELTWRRKSSAKSVLRTRKEAGRTWEVLVGWQRWPLKTSCLWWPVWGSGSGGCSRSWHTFLVCRRLVCDSPFKKWISFLYLRLGRLPPWPSWEDVKASMAECFRANYPDTFIVLDATELCTEIRSCLALQSLLYSSYKSRTTLKDLIVISPNGSIYFVSELWSGSISDRELVIKSVMFCLSNFFLSSHSQAVLPFNFFFSLSVFLHLFLVDLHDCFTSIMFCLSNKKILIIAFTSIVLFQSPFFSNFFRVCWFGWLIHEHHVFF